jgi:hypothetical protein
MPRLYAAGPNAVAIVEDGSGVLRTFKTAYARILLRPPGPLVENRGSILLPTPRRRSGPDAWDYKAGTRPVG